MVVEEIKVATGKCFENRIREIDRRLTTYKMLLKEGLTMISSLSMSKMPTFLLSAKSFRLLRCVKTLIPLGHYESCWVLLRASYEANRLGAHLSRDETDALKWVKGKRIPMRRIKSKGLVATWDSFWDMLCDRTHPNIEGLSVYPLKVDEESKPFALMVTDPPAVDIVFDFDECSHLLLHLDVEICKGAWLQLILFRNDILDRSIELSDRFTELFKHFTRLLGRPDLAKRIRKIEEEFGLDAAYRKGKRECDTRKN